MALPSFLKRKASDASPAGDEAIVARARTGARRRMVGAAILLAVGVIAFPLLFETQPRPIPVDIPIEIPRKDGLPPLAAPPKAARVVSGQVALPPASAVVEPVPSASASASATTPPKAVAGAEPASAGSVGKVGTAAVAASRVTPAVNPPAPAPSQAPAKDTRPTATAALAVAAAPGKPASAPTAQETAGRFVVQVGAFADATAARETRLKVEKLGMKTYTQVVETAQGKRIRVRVGPFDSQAEAARALARLKAAQLPGAVLTL